MDAEGEIFYDDNGSNELYTRHWLECVTALSFVITNIDLS